MARISSLNFPKNFYIYLKLPIWSRKVYITTRIQNKETIIIIHQDLKITFSQFTIIQHILNKKYSTRENFSYKNNSHGLEEKEHLKILQIFI